MNGLNASLEELESLKGLVSAGGNPGCDIAICVPATLIAGAVNIVSGSTINIGGQDCHALASGAHTGDISAEMLADTGATHVIVGHSERRADHGESDAQVRAKAEAAIRAGLHPIICVGETGDEREAGKALAIVDGQLSHSIPELAANTAITIAYEPVWAIGTGLTPTLDDISQMHAAIRKHLVNRFGAAGERIAIVYGGSMKPANAGEILALADVNGGLVGGASLKAADFIAIIQAV